MSNKILDSRGRLSEWCRQQGGSPSYKTIINNEMFWTECSFGGKTVLSKAQHSMDMAEEDAASKFIETADKERETLIYDIRQKLKKIIRESPSRKDAKELAGSLYDTMIGEIIDISFQKI